MNVEFTVLKRSFEAYQAEYEAAALRVLRSGWYVLGNELAEFEKHFADFIGVADCIGVGNGLDALRLAVRALDIGEGDEVIVPANTFIATALAVTESKATPVFVEPDAYFGLDTDKIEAAITPRTKAIIPVHLYGQPCDMTSIKRIANAHKLYIIEDCAQCHGAAYNGKMAGSFGDIACFSFYPTKPMGALGDAGAIVTGDKALAEKLRMLRNYGSRIKYQHEVTGVNSRLDELQAALLKVSMAHCEAGNVERQSIAQRYINEINNPSIRLPQTRIGATHVYHIFPVLCSRRDELQAHLQRQGINAQIHYPIPCHLAKCYASLGYREGAFPIAESFAKEELSLPIYVGMPDAEINWVIACINRFE